MYMSLPTRMLQCVRVVKFGRLNLVSAFQSKFGAAYFCAVPALPIDATPVKAEERMRDLLSERLNATHCTVEDTSGGCGAFYRIRCVSAAFEGMRPLAQHRKVQEVLQKEIGTMHGLTIETHTPLTWRVKNQLP